MASPFSIPSQEFFNENVAGSIRRSQGAKMGDIISVLDFAANGVSGAAVDPTGVLDSTLGIQAAINAASGGVAGRVFVPAGTYAVSSPVLLKSNVRLIGGGSGNYTNGAATRITTIQPTSGFSGSAVILADPANEGSGPYILGVGLSNITIDMTNQLAATAIKLLSVSRVENFSNLRITNHDTGTSVYIGLSANGGALQSDGVTFDNLFTLSNAIDPNTTTPMVVVENANEINFRDCYVTRRSNNAPVAGSIIYHVRSTTAQAVNFVRITGGLVGGAETGVKVEGVTSTPQAPRWVQVATRFESIKYGVWALSVTGKPTQFNTFGPGISMQTTQVGGRVVRLDEFATNNTVILDEFVGTGGDATNKLVSLSANASSNLIIAQPSQVTDSGTSNVVLGRGGVANHWQLGDGTPSGVGLDIMAASGGFPQISLRRPAGELANIQYDGGASRLRLYSGAQNVSIDTSGNMFAPGGLSPGTDGGAAQTGRLLMGSGVPNNANGNNGDIYFRTDTPGTVNQRMYIRSAGAWVALAL